MGSLRVVPLAGGICGGRLIELLVVIVIDRHVVRLIGLLQLLLLLLLVDNAFVVADASLVEFLTLRWMHVA